MSNQSRPVLPTWLPLTLLAVTILLLFYRLLMGEVLFWGLPSLQFYPWREFAISELAAGRPPLWNPYNGAGAPLFANYQSALLYPPNTLSLLLSGPQMIGWLGMIHLFWAGVGMWLLTGELRLPTLARGVGALAYALNGAVVSRFGTPPMVDTAAWLPWLILAAERVLSRRTLLDLAFLTTVLTMQLLAGHAQWTFYSLIMTGLYALYRLFVAHTDLPPSKLTPLVMLTAGVMLAVGLTAVQLVPTAELQRQSQRSEGVDEDFALNFSYEWPSLITQFNPMFYGNPGNGSYVIPGAYFEMASYIGIFPIIVALLAIGHYVLNRRRLGDSMAIRLIPLFAIVTLIAFIFAFGRNSLLFVFLFRHVPTFNLFQAPARWLLLAVFSLSMLAAIGTSLLKFDRRARSRARLGLAAAVGVTLLGLLLLIIFRDRPLLSGIFVLGVQLIGVGIALATLPKADAPRWRFWAAGVLVFVAADLLWANALSNPTVPASFYDRRASTQEGRTYQTDQALREAEFDKFLLFKDYRVAVQRQDEYRAAGFPNLNMLDRQPSFNTFEPLRPAGIERFTKLLNDHPAPNLYAAAAIPQPGNPSAPRVWLAPTVIRTENPVRAMSDPAWQPMLTAFVEGDAPTLAGAQTGSAQIEQETPTSLRILVDAPMSAALVLADTWYPGWAATMDGTPAPIYRANAAFRAVIVPAGKHTIIMIYVPDSLRIGGVLSLFSVVVLIVLLIAGFVYRRHTPGTQAPGSANEVY